MSTKKPRKEKGERPQGEKGMKIIKAEKEKKEGGTEKERDTKWGSGPCAKEKEMKKYARSQGPFPRGGRQ